ncbi:hypothetical protein GPECTOR_2g987 [Gonium pectorale]|uniref:Uncharacterized protein n=1 Tax=Gonium pectorale TaxID=33097 RepID=A0A150H222_GONPE|nr:hypothetical protein GPECTOR_2g987 [Gonium pectorale]|eukprot:KXZ56105.1 hypothetical protein GPECTOR_2g987 [Gonium pectorale]
MLPLLGAPTLGGGPGPAPTAPASAAPGADAAASSSGAAAEPATPPSGRAPGGGPFGGGPSTSSGPGAVYSLPDLSRCDCAAFVFDSSSAESWAWAQRSMLTLCSLPGCETLPVLLVAAKDDVGMCEELRRAVEAACSDLALPAPLSVSAADPAAMGRVFRSILSACFLTPESHIPDTPARKGRRRFQRQVIIGGAAAGALVLAGAALWLSWSGGDKDGGAAKEGGGGGGGKGGAGGRSAAGGGSGGAAGPDAGAAPGANVLQSLFGVPTLGDKLHSLFR